VDQLLSIINSCLGEIDQILIPSTINNFINLRHIVKKEREIISVFDEADPRALNFLISHVRLGLVFYKIKDHRSFGGQNRTEMIELLAVNRLSALTVLSRAVVLHALQIMKLPANARAEYWVRNILLKTFQDDLSDLKTLTDAKGNYFCMNKLVFEDIRSETVRQDILKHIKKQADTQQAHMKMGTKRAKERKKRAWRKILSDVDDTLTCSGGSYPAGVDRRYGKKTVYPGVLAFYRELDLGAQGPETWPPHMPGNLVFLSARPHVYKDVSEKHSFAKFQKLQERGMHTMPSLLAGDMKSGGAFMLNKDMDPLATKKYENFKKYVAIYPEFKHIFIGDNGQGDVRAGELMFDNHPEHFEALYVHVVQDLHRTHGYAPERWRAKGLKPCFFRTYPDAAIHAATRNPPFIRMSGLRRICEDAKKDFCVIQPKQWPSTAHKYLRREELNQGICRANQVLIKHGEKPVKLLGVEQVWKVGQKVRTPYGVGTIRSFNPIFDMYEVDIDWRPLTEQLAESKQQDQITIKIEIEQPKGGKNRKGESVRILETVMETNEIDEEGNNNNASGGDKTGNLHIEVTLGASGSAITSTSSITTSAPLSPRSSITLSRNDSDSTMLASNTELLARGVSRAAARTAVDANASSCSATQTSSLSDVNSVNTGDWESISSFPSISSLPSEYQNQGHPDALSSLPSFGDDSSVNNTPMVEDELSDQGSEEDNLNLRPKSKVGLQFGFARARIQGRYITKYSPPKLPSTPRDFERKGSLFSFWASSDALRDNPKRKPIFSTGQTVRTPYGSGQIVEQRISDGVVVVKMNGFSATAYLNKASVTLLEKGFINSLFRQLVASEITADKKRKQPEKDITQPTEKPFSVGTVVQTPFGKGTLIRALSERKESSPLTSKSAFCDANYVPPKSLVKKMGDNPEYQTVGIQLESWKLSNDE